MYFAVGDKLDLSGVTATGVSYSGTTLTVTATKGQTLTFANFNGSLTGTSPKFTNVTTGKTTDAYIYFDTSPSFSIYTPSLTVAENAAATSIGIATPIDPSYAASALTLTVTALPTDGTITLADGKTAVRAGEHLTIAQLTGLKFKPTAGAFGVSSSFHYTLTDPAKHVSPGSATLAIGPAVGNPVVSSPSLTVAKNAAATSIRIASPTDPNYVASTLTLTVTALPTDGKITQADGTTAVSLGENLTLAQLTGLKFKPTTGDSGVTSSFRYTVTDPAKHASIGIATLAIEPAAGNGGTNSAAQFSAALFEAAFGQGGGDATALAHSAAPNASGVFAIPGVSTSDIGASVSAHMDLFHVA